MRKITAAVLILLAMFLYCSCGDKPAEAAPNDYPVTVYDVTVDACPQKIVSLSPAVTDIITALGSYAQLAGVSDNCSNDAGLPTFGTAALPDLGTLANDEIDLVFAPESMPDSVRESIRALGKTLIVVPSCQSYNSLMDIYIAVGRAVSGNVTGDRNAQNTFSRIDGKIKTVSNKLGSADATAVLLLDRGISAPTDSLAGEMLAFAGGSNMAPDGYSMTDEQLSAANPQFIFCPENIAEEIMTGTIFSELDAVKNGRVVAVDPLCFERPDDDLAYAVQLMAWSMYPDSISAPEGYADSSDADSDFSESASEPAVSADSLTDAESVS